MGLMYPYADIPEPSTPSKEEWFIGNVVDNEDPLKLRRLKIYCAMYDDLSMEDLPWASPIPNTFLGTSANAEDFAVPEVGSQVRVFFPTHDPDTPFYMGAEKNEYNRCTFFDEDYPNSYGRKDSVGNFFKVNKVKETVHMQHSSGTNLQIDKEGSATVTMAGGSQLEVNAAGQVTWIQGDNVVRFKSCMDGTVVLECGILQINAPSFKVNANDAVFTGSLTSSKGKSTSFEAGGKYFIFNGGLLTDVK